MRLFDSNILIYHLNDAFPSDARRRVEAWIVEGGSLSVITRIEVLGYPQTSALLRRTARLIALFEEIPLHEAVVRRTIDLRQAHRIRIPDAIIAASALTRGVPLVTRNRRDFQAIEGLKVLDPFV